MKNNNKVLCYKIEAGEKVYGEFTTGQIETLGFDSHGLFGGIWHVDAGPTPEISAIVKEVIQPQGEPVVPELPVVPVLTVVENNPQPALEVEQVNDAIHWTSDTTEIDVGVDFGKPKKKRKK